MIDFSSASLTACFRKDNASMNRWINKQALSRWQQIIYFPTKDVISPEKETSNVPKPCSGDSRGCWDVLPHTSCLKYMFMFFCVAVDAFKKHYFWELQSLPKALSFSSVQQLERVLIFSKWTGRGPHWYWGDANAVGASLFFLLLFYFFFKGDSFYCPGTQPVLKLIVFYRLHFICPLISHYFKDKKTNILFILLCVHMETWLLWLRGKKQAEPTMPTGPHGHHL